MNQSPFNAFYSNFLFVIQVHYIKNKTFTKDELEKLEYKYADAIFSYIKTGLSSGDDEELTKAEKKFIKNSSESFQVLLKSYIGRKNKTDDLVEEHNKLLKKYLKAMVSYFKEIFLEEILSIFLIGLQYE